MHDAVLDALSESFGDNAGFALELYAQYRLNPGTVGDDWRRTFEQFEKRARAGGGARTDPPAPSPAAPGPSPRRRPLPALRPRFRPRPPGPRPRRCGRERSSCPLVGGSATIARNMDASLAVPTATSQRVIPVKAMEENRRILNHHREAVRQSKISFTHLVAWAIVRALEKHPGMNDAYAEAEGTPAARPEAAREPRRRGRRDEEGRVPDPSRPEHQARRGARLRRVRRHVRQPRRQGAPRDDRARGLPRNLDLADEPRHARDDLLGPAPDAGPGLHRRDRGDGLPARVPGDARGDRREPRDLPGHGGHVDVRPPDRPGGRVGGVPRDAPGAPSRRRRLLREDLQGPEGAAPARRLGAGPEPAAPRAAPRASRRWRSRRGSCRSSTSTASGGTCWPTSTRSASTRRRTTPSSTRRRSATRSGTSTGSSSRTASRAATTRR